MDEVKALTFDVFGTVVDWRNSIARELEHTLAPRGIRQDWLDLADHWRDLYDPAMKPIREGKRDFVILDVLHRENLLELLHTNDIGVLNETEIGTLAKAWHRLDPWPDCVEGLGRLKQKFVLVTLSNGNISLMVNLARYGNLPWDAVLGAEISRSYKPSPQTYLGTAAALGLEPQECMMVAAHNSDLRAARSHGFRTAFVSRPREHGPDQRTDLDAEDDWDVVCESMIDLADKLL